MVGFKFQSPAIYKIEVEGSIFKNWSEKLGGMQINVLQSKGSDTTSELIGRINDQTALSSILKTLYEHRFSIISVKMINDNV